MAQGTLHDPLSPKERLKICISAANESCQCETSAYMVMLDVIEKRAIEAEESVNPSVQFDSALGYLFCDVCDQESVMKPTHNLPEDVPTDRIFGSPMSGISSNWKRSSDTHLRNAPIRFCWHKNNVNFSIRDCTVSTITCSYLFLVSSFLWFLKYSPFFNFLPSDGCNGRRKVTCKDARLADNTTRFCQRNIPGMEKYHGDSLICTSLGFFPMPKRRPTLLSNIILELKIPVKDQMCCWVEEHRMFTS